ncbi:MAG: phage holin family protein [Deltaproteobacteria bacterium]|nr:phage holin family protein [Deltaproteobacteria bacterium]
MKGLLLRLGVNAVALLAADFLIDGVHLGGGLFGMLAVALVFGLVNALIKPFVLLLSLPAVVMTLGLFTWVVNAAMLGLTAAFTDSLDVDGLWSALGGSLVVSVVSALLSRYTGEQRAR